ncbi:MAG: hypothetical protein GVY29_13460 [Spirochaetes bacterium]|jgi:hypothetical protein|nr:hypothetical protein [Spirochaetota bacterium]
MRKVVLIVLAILMIAAMSASADTFGVGVAAGLNPLGGLPGQNVMLSVKFPQLPVLWGIGMQLSQDTFGLGLTADWWLFTQNLFSFVNLYIGPGLYVAVPNFELGGRVPIGLNAYPIEVLELFLEFAPTWAPITGNGFDTGNFGLQGSFGLRFWFDT